MWTHTPRAAALEIREQLVSDKRRVAFLFGAGTSMAVGLPGIVELTTSVQDRLEGSQKSLCESIHSCIGSGANIEKILDRIRAIRELIGRAEDTEYDGIRGASAARLLDTSICRAIRTIVTAQEYDPSFPHEKLARWLHYFYAKREFPVEIFTTNYDLLFEQALEDAGVPYFDGFIGAVAPFFSPESVDADLGRTFQTTYPPQSWTRLWKLHGSVNWCLRADATHRERITRAYSGNGDDIDSIIFPSRDKYTLSRRVPFVAFHDRLRRLLLQGEILLVISGYSFSDQHINEVIFQGLQSNSRCSVTCLLYTDPAEDLSERAAQLPNLSIYGRKVSCLAGKVYQWSESETAPGDIYADICWSTENKVFTLGDFSSFCELLNTMSGDRRVQVAQALESTVNQAVTEDQKVDEGMNNAE